MSSDKVNKSGDTMSGNLSIQKSLDSDVFLNVKDATNNKQISFGFGTSGKRGIYDYSIDNWIFHMNGTDAYVNNTKVPYNGGELALKSDITDALKVDRIIQTANTKPGQYKYSIIEYDNHSTELPNNAFYHIITIEGQDTAYATQLAIGMTTRQIFYRICNANTWDSSWKELAFKEEMVSCPVVYLDPNQSATFHINGFAKIMVGHPYEGGFGEYMVQAGYTTGQSASLVTFHASDRVASISKPTVDTVQITASANIFVQVMCVGASIVTS